MTSKQWIYALADSIINGIALAALTYFVIPQTSTELWVSIQRLWIIALGGAIIGFFNHLRQSPISKIVGMAGVLLLALSLPALSFAAPFLVCDPQAGVTHYKLTGPAWVPATSTAQPDGSIRMDVSGASQGNNALTVRACKTDPIWGELCSDPATPFAFARPGAPSVPGNLRLIQ